MRPLTLIVTQLTNIFALSGPRKCNFKIFKAPRCGDLQDNANYFETDSKET